MEKATDMDIVRMQQSLTVRRAVNAPKIGEMKQAGLAGQVQGVVLKLTHFLNNMLSLEADKKMTPAQKQYLMGEIITRYHNLTLQEILLVMRQGIRGDYDKLLYRIDPNVVISWFEKYLASEERIAIWESSNQQYKQTEQTGINTEAMSEKGKAVMKRILKDLEPRAKKSVALPVLPDITKMRSDQEVVCRMLTKNLPEFRTQDLQMLLKDARENNLKEVVEFIEDELHFRKQHKL